MPSETYPDNIRSVPASPATPFFVSGGTVPRDAPCYVYRDADHELYAALGRGELCYVLTARQMGKSSLMVRTAARLRAVGVASAILDLTRLGRHLTMDQWYKGLIALVGRQLDLEDECEDYWRSVPSMSPLQRWTATLYDVVLKRLTGNLVIFIDEIDSVRSLPFSSDEFFAAIRALYNSRTEDAAARRITFCILGVASPTDLIRDPRTTPFNVARRIELTDLTDLSPLAAGFGCDPARAARLLKRVKYWTGGHPYLTQRVCALLANSRASRTARGVDRLCLHTFVTSDVSGEEDNLVYVRDSLLRGEMDSTELLGVYLQVVSGQRVPDDPADPRIEMLRLSGVVRGESGMLKVHNRIYGCAFDRRWVLGQLPDAEVRRQKAAFRRGVIRATAVGGLVAMVLAFVAIQAVRLADEAKRGEAAARAAMQIASQRGRESLATARLYQQIAQREALDLARSEKAERQAGASRKAALEARRRAEASARAARLAASGERAANVRIKQDAALQRALRRLADERAILARNQSDAARQGFYQAAVSLAALQLRNPTRGQPNAAVASSQSARSDVESLLQAQRPRPGQRDLRGFEWYYLDKLARREVIRIGSHVPPPGHDERSAIVESLAFSPDGGMLASAGDDGAIKLWDVSRRAGIGALRANGPRVLSVAFSPDGSMLASGGSDNAVTLWNMKTRSPLAVLKGHTEDVDQVAFSPDGSTLASASDDKTVRIWDVRTGICRNVWTGFKDWVQCVAFCGRVIAAGCMDGTTHLWDSSAARERATSAVHAGATTAIAFENRNGLIFTGGQDSRINEVQANWWLAGHLDRISALACGGGLLLSTSLDGTARLWRMGVCIGELKGRTAPIHSGAITGDGHVVALGDRFGGVYLWDLRKGREDRSFFSEPPRYTEFVDLRFGGAGHLIAAEIHSDRSGLMQLLCADLTSDQLIASIATPLDGRSTAVLSPDCSRVAFTPNETSVRLWNIATGSIVKMRMPVHEAVVSFAFSADGRWLGGAGGRGDILLWDTRTANSAVVLAGGRETVTLLAFPQRGHTLASADARGVVRVWDYRHGRLVCTAPTGLSDPQACAFSSDGRQLAVSNIANLVALVDADTGAVQTTRTAQPPPIYGLAFTADGARLATLASDGSVALWRVPGLVALGVLSDFGLRPIGRVRPDSPAGICAFSPDGRSLAGFDNGFGIMYDTRPDQDGDFGAGRGGSGSPPLRRSPPRVSAATSPAGVSLSRR